MERPQWHPDVHVSVLGFLPFGRLIVHVSELYKRTDSTVALKSLIFRFLDRFELQISLSLLHADQAIAFIAAGLVPSFVLIFLFGIKAFVDLRKVSRGEDGPWAVKQAGRASVVATMETIRLAQKAMATADAEINAADYSNDNVGEDDEKSA